MRFKYLLVIALGIVHQAHAELWKDVSSDADRQQETKVFMNEVTKISPDGTVLASYKISFGNQRSFTLHEISINCVDEVVRYIKGHIYADDSHPTRDYILRSGGYKEIKTTASYYPVYKEVCLK